MMYPTEQDSPTFWPASPKEKTAMELAIETLAEENRSLKNLVRRLSEIILKDVTGIK